MLPVGELKNLLGLRTDCPGRVAAELPKRSEIELLERELTLEINTSFSLRFAASRIRDFAPPAAMDPAPLGDASARWLVDNRRRPAPSPFLRSSASNHNRVANCSYIYLRMNADAHALSMTSEISAERGDGQLAHWKSCNMVAGSLFAIESA